MAIVSRELVAAEACYHKSCYRNYTRNILVSGDKKEDNEYIENSRAELQGYAICLIDGMALVQRLKGDQRAFAEIAES